MSSDELLCVKSTVYDLHVYVKLSDIPQQLWNQFLKFGFRKKRKYSMPITVFVAHAITLFFYLPCT